jgi:hypothetical protein
MMPQTTYPPFQGRCRRAAPAQALPASKPTASVRRDQTSQTTRCARRGHRMIRKAPADLYLGHELQGAF